MRQLSHAALGLTLLGDYLMVWLAGDLRKRYAVPVHLLLQEHSRQRSCDFDSVFGSGSGSGPGPGSDSGSDQNPESAQHLPLMRVALLSSSVPYSLTSLTSRPSAAPLLSAC